MIENFLLLALVAFAALMVLALPWIMIVTTVWEYKKGIQPNDLPWLGFPLCVFFCIWEVTAALDWLFGLGGGI